MPANHPTQPDDTSRGKMNADRGQTALSQDHRQMLFEDSGISPDVASERGYRTVRNRAELLEFSKGQRRLGLYVPMCSPDGKKTLPQVRPYSPRKGKNGKPVKYETPTGAEMIVDVHPSMRDRVRYSLEPLWITEGVKCADAMTSRGLPTVALAGVWMWCVPKANPKRLLPCFDHMRLTGRRVYVVFDSDVMVKPEVQLALECLVAALEDRGADVRVVYLPDAEDGSKRGVDDYLAAGGTVAELKMLARRFDPGEIGRIRLSHDEQLCTLVSAAWARWEGEGWSRMVGTGERPNSMRGHGCRDAAKVLIDAATKSGKPVADGLEVTIDVRTWAERAATRVGTLQKAVRHLEAEVWLRKGECSKRGTVYTILVPRAKASHKESKGAAERESEKRYYPSVSPLRAPRLRWSAPTFDREGDRIVRGYIRRLGKINGAIIDALDKRGPMHIDELADALNRRKRDLYRRNVSRLKEAGLIIEEDGTLSLTDDWLEALDRERDLKGEVEAGERQRAAHRRQRIAYRNRDKTQPDAHPANVGADGYIEDLQPADAEPEPDPEPSAPEISPLAVAIREYLDRNPQDACQPPGWIGTTLWAYYLCPGKPTPAEIRLALDELGGEAFLRVHLERARRAA